MLVTPPVVIADHWIAYKKSKLASDEWNVSVPRLNADSNTRKDRQKMFNKASSHGDVVISNRMSKMDPI